MYLRFVSMDIDPTSHVWAGIFTAARFMRDELPQSDHELDQLWALADWFNEHLPAPNRFARNTRNRYASPGVCWFRESARTHLARIWEMVALLEDNGVWIRMLKTDRPGYIVYEDDWQIVAVPFGRARY